MRVRSSTARVLSRRREQGPAVGASNHSGRTAMNLYAPPHLRCPACRRMVPFDPYVEIIGELAVLDCPHCSGVRVDLAIEQVLARN